jgi:hypothetical protein
VAQDIYIKNGLAIINPYGGVWTDEVFQTPEDAMKYLNEFWKGKNDRLKEYKLAVATLTITLDRSPGEPIFIPLPQP